jgi:hypothetical protein
MLTTYLTGTLNENGTPRVGYTWDGSDMPEGSGLVVTFSAKGTVMLKNGHVYDVTAQVIEHLPGDSGPLIHHIEKQLEASGEADKIQPGYKHTCTEACGSEAE